MPRRQFVARAGASCARFPVTRSSARARCGPSSPPRRPAATARVPRVLRKGDAEPDRRPDQRAVPEQHQLRRRRARQDAELVLNFQPVIPLDDRRRLEPDHPHHHAHHLPAVALQGRARGAHRATTRTSASATSTRPRSSRPSLRRDLMVGYRPDGDAADARPAKDCWAPASGAPARPRSRSGCRATGSSAR